MNKLAIFMGFVFFEIVVEIGFKLKTLIVTGLSVKNVLLYGLLLVLIVNIFSGKKWEINNAHKNVNKLYIAIVIYSIFSLSFHIMLGQSAYDVFAGALSLKSELIDSLVCFIVFSYFIKQLDDAINISRFMVLVIGLASFMTVVDAASASINFFGYDDFNRRTNGAMGEPNQTAAVIALYFPMAVVLSLIKGKFRLVFIGTSMVMAAALLSTGSRGGMLASLLGVLYAFFLMRKELSVGRKFFIISSVVFGAIIVWIMIPDYYKESLIGRFSFLNESKVNWKNATAGRSFLWSNAYDLWLESPIIGQGWHAFKIIVNMASHNTFVEYAVSLGVAGLTMYLFLWAKIHKFISNAKKYTENRDQNLMLYGFQGGIVSIMIAVFFVNLYRPWYVVWPFIGVGMAYANHLRLNKLNGDDHKSEVEELKVSSNERVSKKSFENVRLR